jgi:inosose dehydratase
MSNTTRSGQRRSVLERLAAGPISWGVCEVPGWGIQLSPDRVLGEMRSLGIRATEAGPDGWLGYDSVATQTLLEHDALELVGGFLPLVLHDPVRLDASLDKVRRTAELYVELGAGVICSAAVVDDDWAPRIELGATEWGHLLHGLGLVDELVGEYGVAQTFHPHWGTLVETDEELKRVFDNTAVSICLDTGHLSLGGSDPLEIARDFGPRVGHVHLKDVRSSVVAGLRRGELGLMAAVQAGLFQPLGTGDVAVDEVVATLERSGYGGWYVLEQDTALTAGIPDAGEGPIEDVRRSIDFLRAAAPEATRVSNLSEGG